MAALRFPPKIGNASTVRRGRGKQMATIVNAGARLDRLPISSFHYRIFWLVGAGMFFDGYDLYVAGGVLAATVQSKFSTVPQNLQFISLTFVGMTIGSLLTGFVGDKYGRRFTYQVNLLVFGLASLAAAFAQDMNQLIACRFVQGLGLGAEIVVGYSTLTEFVPPKTRGRWLSMMAFLVVAGFPVTALLGYLIITRRGDGARCSSSPALAHWSSGICARIFPSRRAGSNPRAAPG